MPQYRVMFARFPFGNQECPDSVDWLVETVLKAKADPRISEVLHYRKDDTPITMGRNHCIEVARRHNVDLLLMLDSDMAPDLKVPGARPFWDSSFEFWLQHRPCLIGAPYCGPPPFENVYVFRWANARSHNANPDQRLEQYTREEAAERIGFEEVAALPTGLIMIDMEAIKRIKPPYFYYEWKDETESQKASTEDVTFTRDLSLNYIKTWVNWDAWAGHWKRLCVGKPQLITVDSVRQKFVDAVLAGHRSTESLAMVGENGVDSPRGFRNGMVVR